jgi:Integrase core domain
MASGSSWASMSPSPRFRFIWCPGGIDHCDLFVVPTIAFQHLFAFLVLSHERRRLLRFAVTRNPTAEWLARQITEAFPWDSTPKYLIRDNARAFGVGFKARVRAMGIRDRPTSFRSPWQNGYTESLIDSIRRECTDHLIVFNAEHLRRILAKYAIYYNEVRAHVFLGKEAPCTRAIELFGDIVAHPILGGLHIDIHESDLFGSDTNSVNKKHSSATIVADVKRFCHRVKRTKFSAHTGHYSGSYFSPPNERIIASFSSRKSRSSCPYKL